MSNDNTDGPQLYNLSRRRVLAGLGAIGLASAGAGLGTSAYFSDQETFTNNSLVAGSLDMKVDWEEHYSDWSDDEAQYARMPEGEEDVDIRLPAVTSGGELIPDARPIELVLDGEDAAAKQTAKDNLWDTTSVEAYPDGTDGDQDGIQDAFDDALVCENDLLADVGGGSGGLSSANRTTGTFAGQTTESGDPLINIDDVKPGDFGEVTFSFHLCDNPGYVWVNGELVDWSEGDPMYTEPELSDPDEDGSANPTVDDIELLDEVVTRMWYDPNGNNQVDVIGGELDIMMAIDASGSIEGDKTTDDTEANNLVEGVDAFVSALAGLGAAGSLALGAGFYTSVTRAQPYTKYTYAGTDDAENGVNKPESRDPGEDDTGDGRSRGELGQTMGSSFWQDSGLVGGVGACDGTLGVGETPFESGSLAETFETLHEGVRVADCLGEGERGCVGFEWSLSGGPNNAVQTDSVAFDLAFVGVSCGNPNPFASDGGNA